jgi:hypothetical protein
MKMTDHNIKPEKVTTPIQLLAVWFIALLLLTGTIFTAATLIKEPKWVSPLLVISGIILGLIIVVLIFLMQTKFRPEMLSGKEYLQYMDKKFKDFSPENLNENIIEKVDDNSLEEQRISEYKNSSGLFLTHIWRPSKLKGQVADIRIQLLQHGKGPFILNQIENVEYELGRKFFEKPVIKKNKDDDYALYVSAYAPMLCIAKVNLKDRKTLILKRYIDFEY